MTYQTLCQWIINHLRGVADGRAAPVWDAATISAVQWICRVHGLASLLAAEASFQRQLPPDLQAWFISQHSFNQQRIAALQADLAAILHAFHPHGIRVMPMKGAVLGACCYTPASLRPMADLDLLIQPADEAATRRVLGDLGYQPTVPHWKHTEFSRPTQREVVDPTCEHPDNPRSVELHRHCRESFGGPTVDLTATMWQESHGGELLGQPAHLPTSEGLLLHLLVHATYHFWQGRGRLIQLVDLHRLTQHRPPDAARLVEVLNAVSARYVYPSLLLWHKTFPSGLTESLVRRQRVSAPFRAWAEGLDVVNSSYLNPAPPGLYLRKALRWSEGRPHEVWQAMRFALLPHMSEIALDHPRLARAGLGWLAYPLLPFDWLRRVIRRR